MERIPSPPGPLANQRQSSGLLGCMMLGLVGTMAVAGMVALSLLSSGLFTPALLAGAGFFAYALFHYLVWGWWLSGAIRRDAMRDELIEKESQEFANAQTASKTEW
jgi:hypothetical protein